MVGLWSGLVFGLVEVGIVRLQLVGSRKFTFMSPDFPWMTPVAKGAMASILLDRHRLVRNGDGSMELYDFLSNPEETSDLSQAPEFADVLTRLQAALQLVAGPPTGRGPRYRGPPRLAGP